MVDPHASPSASRSARFTVAMLLILFTPLLGAVVALELWHPVLLAWWR